MSTRRTPMLEQYFSIKEKYADCIVLFRLGDFYEMFDEDAKVAAPVLDLTLTGRDAGKDERIPMRRSAHAVDTTRQTRRTRLQSSHL